MLAVLALFVTGLSVGLILMTLRLRHYRARAEARPAAPPAPTRPVVTPGPARKVA
jgi:type III secretion protein J